MTTTQYEHLQPEDRVTIASLTQQDHGVRAIARTLGRPASRVSRELRRDTVAGVACASTPDQKASRARRAAAWCWPKLHPEGRLWMTVSTCLPWRWSQHSGQAARLRHMGSDDGSMHVSHETIYTATCAHASGELRSQLIACLRQGKRTRRPRSGRQDRRGRMPERVSIHVRPPEVEDRVMPSHCEGDLIKRTANRSAVGVPGAAKHAPGAADQDGRRHGRVRPQGLRRQTQRHRRAAAPDADVRAGSREGGP